MSSEYRVVFDNDDSSAFVLTQTRQYQLLSSVLPSGLRLNTALLLWRLYEQPDGFRTIEALPEAQQEWVDQATALVAATVLVHPSCSSWYNGGNVPGKKRMYMGYTAGIPEYRRRCDEIADAGYAGFKLA